MVKKFFVIQKLINLLFFFTAQGRYVKSAQAWRDLHKDVNRKDPKFHPFHIQRTEAGHIKKIPKEEPIQYCVKNKSPEEILDVFYEVRSRWGNKSHSMQKQKFTMNPSIQGIWNPLRIIY